MQASENSSWDFNQGTLCGCTKDKLTSANLKVDELYSENFMCKKVNRGLNKEIRQLNKEIRKLKNKNIKQLKAANIAPRP